MVQRTPWVEVGHPADALEDEAERIADQATRGSANLRVSGSAVGAPVRLAGGDGTVSQAADDAFGKLSGGMPLPPAERAFFEARLGFDFSRVRVHADDAGGAAARAVGARAFARGLDIGFSVGAYAPGTPQGRRLLAHELTHIVQQAGNRPSAMAGGGLVQREPTRPRAATSGESIADLTAQTATATGKVTAGSMARMEWESLFKRHFTEPDKVLDEVESSHARYLYSNIYGWIDAQHFFAHIQFAEDLGLQGATAKGISIEEKQQIVRAQVAPGPGDPDAYRLLVENNLLDPESLEHYRDDLLLAVDLAADLVLSAQEAALIKGFTDQQMAKLVLDNALSAWSYEDLVSNQLGVQFFGQHGAFVNAGTDAADVRRRFIERIEDYFTSIQVLSDPAAVKAKAKSLPGKERWTSPKLTLPKARARFPELFEFGAKTHRIRIAVYSTRETAQKWRDEVVKAVPSVSGSFLAPYGKDSIALYTLPLSRFEAVLLKRVIDRAVSTGPGGALIEAQP
jgi:hypothetical protein